ncbi:MAG: twin-arginine translocase subunit TatC [Burkholderiales bacterium]
MYQEIVTQLIEIRKRLIFMLIGFAIVFFGLFHFANTIYAVLAHPLLIYLPHGTTLIATDVTAPFFVPLKLTVIVALILSLPNTLYQLWCYVAPALYYQERKLFLLTTFMGIILFLSGILFCYFIVLPLLFGFIGQIKSSQIVMLADISKYLDFILNLFLVFGLCFQMPIVIFLLIYFKIVDHAKLLNLRPYIFVACFILAAIVTPPDVFSQTLLALPLYLLYELGMLVGKLTLSKRMRNNCPR